MSNNPTALGIHIYAGGYTQGMKQHLDVERHLEISSFGVKTMQHNLQKEVQVDKNAIWDQSFKRYNVVYGNPPCVAFSRLGHRAYLEHPSIADVRSLLRVGVLSKPDIWTWECVPQAYSKGGPLVEEVAKTWRELGYHCIVFLTDVNLHGAAQLRQRFHFIATRVKLNLYDPHLTNYGGNSMSVLTDEPEVPKEQLKVRGYLNWMEPYAIPGHALRKVWFHLHGLKGTAQPPAGTRHIPPFCIQRLHPERPSQTLTGGPDFIHPKEWRVLSPGEMGLLCGFPKSWKWLGNLVDQYKQVAKGVTPVIGDYLGEVFKRGIEQGQGIEQPGFEVIDYSKIGREHWSGIRPEPLPRETFGICKDSKVVAEQIKLPEPEQMNGAGDQFPGDEYAKEEVDASAN